MTRARYTSRASDTRENPGDFLTQADVTNGLAARAHSDANPSAKQSARRNRRGLSTEYRWRDSGPPQLTSYLLNAPDKYRLVAHAKAIAMEEIRKESRAEIIKKTRALLRQEKAVEGADNGNDVTRGINWLDRAAQKERDAAIDEELAARFRRCAELRIPETEIFG